MWPDRVANPGPLTYESGVVLPTALRGPAKLSALGRPGYIHAKDDKGLLSLR